MLVNLFVSSFPKALGILVDSKQQRGAETIWKIKSRVIILLQRCSPNIFSLALSCLVFSGSKESFTVPKAAILQPGLSPEEEEERWSRIFLFCTRLFCSPMAVLVPDPLIVFEIVRFVLILLGNVAGMWGHCLNKAAPSRAGQAGGCCCQLLVPGF